MYIRFLKALVAIIVYFVVSVLLSGMDYREILNNTQLIAVTIGIVLLTFSQYQKGLTRDDLVQKAKSNALLAGGITTLFSLMNAFNQPLFGNQAVAQAFLPLLYGALWYAVLNSNVIRPRDDKPREDNSQALNVAHFMSPEVAYPILTQKGFTPREIHVAIRLLHNSTNKEIADDLFITEATVKKHIQNMFKKCGAMDRQDFLVIYMQWVSIPIE